MTDPTLTARRIVLDVLLDAATEDGPRGAHARAELETRTAETRAALRRAGQAYADAARTVADALRPLLRLIEDTSGP